LCVISAGLYKKKGNGVKKKNTNVKKKLF